MPQPRRKKPAPQQSRAWPADRVERRAVASLVPYAKNARRHSAEQIEQLAESIKEWGWTIPVLVDEAGTLIAGHGRVLAAKKLGLDEVPVMVAAGWSEAQRRAYVIADNRLAENASWDEDLLRLELGDLRDLNFDLGLTGFGGADLTRMFSIDPASLAEREFKWKGEAHKRLFAAWRVLLADWRDIMIECRDHGRAFNGFTRGTLAVQFVRSLYTGEDIARGLTTAYTPHRLFLPGDAYSLFDLFDAIEKEPAIFENLRFAIDDKPSFSKFLFSMLAVRGRRAPADFPSQLARSLYDELAPAGAAVLDPCAGWGGRMLGFLLSKTATTYRGFDVDPLTTRGLSEMFADLHGFAEPGKAARVDLCPFEDAELEPSSFDFAMTSPPYFDTEHYGGDLSSWRRYPTLGAWNDGFFSKLIANTAAALKPKALFALQIGNQRYPLEDFAREHAKAHGLRVVERRATHMTNNQADTTLEDGEAIVIFQKTAPRTKKARAVQREPEIVNAT